MIKYFSPKEIKVTLGEFIMEHCELSEEMFHEILASYLALISSIEISHYLTKEETTLILKLNELIKKKMTNIKLTSRETVSLFGVMEEKD